MKQIFFLGGSFVIPAGLLAQDTTYSEFNVKPEELWYLQTPVWIGGAVILLLILIALLRGRQSKLPKNVKMLDGRFTVKKVKKQRSKL